MNKTVIAILIVLGVLGIVLIIVVSSNRRKTAANNAAIESSMIAAQNQAAAECQKSWYCVASNLIGGVGGILGGIIPAKS